MRSGLLKKLTFPDALTNQLVANLSDAINTLSSDDDVFTAPSTVLVGTGKIPAGAATIFYRGAPGAQLTLPSAQAQAVQGNARAALVVLGNESAGAVTLLASGGDTINGAKSLSVGGGALQMVVSDGFSQWLVLAPATILGWITSLTGDVVAVGPGAAAATIAANAVTNAKAAQMASNTIKGNNTGGTANAADLTATQVTAMLNTATSALKGLTPASGGGTTNFLRADLTWAPPTGKTLLRTSVLTSGTTLAKAAGTTLARAWLWGAGGGGGGSAAGAAGQNAVGGGGESGATAFYVTTTIPATWTYAIGAKGTGGANTGANGTNGGDTTLSDGTTTVTAQGGRGGSGGASSASPQSIGGGSGATATNGNVNGAGNPGGNGFTLASGASPVIKGAGGASSWGGAGRQGGVITGASAGNNATAYGSGGGSAGAAASSGAGAVGGDGFQGIIVLEEWG